MSAIQSKHNTALKLFTAAALALPGLLCLPASRAQTPLPAPVLRTPYTVPPASAPFGTPSVAPPAASSAVALPPVVSTTYVLAPLDVIDVSVQGHEDYHTQAALLADGTFNYPTLGAIHAAGLKVAQLQALITKGLSDYFNQPDVTVSVRESHIQKITVSGIARSPGLYDYRPGLTLLEVVSASGGPNQAPESTALSVVSRVGGGTESRPIDLVSLLAGDPKQNLSLAPGDTLLFTPRDPAKSAVQIVGQVNRPGQYAVMRQGATLISMLTQAGGVTPSAALTHVQLVRNGKTYAYNLHDTIYNIDDPSGQITIYAGDVINVPFNNNRIAVQGEVRAPSIYNIPDGEPFTLSTALAQAGGPTNIGDKKDVGILRLLRNGQRTLITVNMEDLYKSRSLAGSRVADIPLQDKDFIIVPTRHIGHSVAEYIGAIPGFYYTSQLLGATPRL